MLGNVYKSVHTFVGTVYMVVQPGTTATVSNGARYRSNEKFTNQKIGTRKSSVKTLTDLLHKNQLFAKKWRLKPTVHGERRDGFLQVYIRVTHLKRRQKQGVQIDGLQKTVTKHTTRIETLETRAKATPPP